MTKRLFDIVVSAGLLVVLSPIVLVLAALVYLKLGKPVLFRQQRPGRTGAPFEMVKFRTMIALHDGHGAPLPDAQRLTPFGKRLRALSLDELPTLWNVLRGDLSLVGPRPLLMQYLPLYTPTQARRHEVRPGITGWAQVNGRNSVDWERKFEMDLWYVENRSFPLDLKILGLTFLKVLQRADVTAPGEATMPAFAGSFEREADERGAIQDDVRAGP